uniref:Uncharacterized protein n=1 Tax=Lygus hesperus TaxID=30085 RepID=A0A146L2G4_LYGHE
MYMIIIFVVKLMHYFTSPRHIAFPFVIFRPLHAARPNLTLLHRHCRVAIHRHQNFYAQMPLQLLHEPHAADPATVYASHASPCATTIDLQDADVVTKLLDDDVSKQ